MTEVADPSRCHVFTRTLSDVLGGLLGAGLSLEVFREYPWSNGCVMWDGMRELPGRRFVPPAELPSIPMMYGLSAVRP
jgi:hypothetical protein